MKLVRQLKLYFREDKSDKVYEIDLCETGPGEYIVNFRYGRRGTALKEGTKTIFPVPLAEAEKLFNSLEQEKRRKGYAENEPGVPPSYQAPQSNTKDKNETRERAVLLRLREAVSGRIQEDWKLSRIIWRAGELKLHEAGPLILRLANPADAFNCYSSVWALARCGSAEAIPFLEDVLRDTKQPAHILQAAWMALFALVQGEKRENFKTSIVNSLPENVKALLAEKKFITLEQQAVASFANVAADQGFLVSLFVLSQDDEELKPTLCHILQQVPLQPGIFRFIRVIFKAAEMLDDFETYALLAKRFESSPAGYSSSKSGMMVDRAYVSFEKEKKKKDPLIAFSSATKAYLERRVIRRLNDYGETEREAYTKLACEILLCYSDAAANSQPRKETKYNYHYDPATRQYNTETVTTHFDAFSSAHLFNTILYTNSPRYQRKQKNKEWKCLPPYEPGQPAPSIREEAFPERWNKDHASVFRLLGESKCSRVQEFAVKVFRANPGFGEKTTEQDLATFLRSGYAATETLAVEIVQERFQRASPGKMLLVALLGCSVVAGRELARQWVLKQRPAFFADAEFVAALIGIRNEETRAWLDGILSMEALPAAVAVNVAERVLQQIVLLSLAGNEEKETEALSAFLLRNFAATLAVLPLEQVRGLVTSPLGNLQALGGRILLRHQRADEAADEFLVLLLQSQDANARAAGIGLLGRLPDDQLVQRKNMLMSFCVSPLPDVRASVRPLIERLAAAYPAFAAEMATLFLPAMQMAEAYEGLHNDLLGLLRGALAAQLNTTGKEQILALIHSRFLATQELGFFLLKQNLAPDTISVRELVKLGSHALLDLRHWVWNVFETSVARIQAEMDEAIRLADSIWEDTRAFAFRHFRERVEQQCWTPQLFVALCDSVREDVQAFGREMITRCFESRDGQDYLLKLSQHPDSRMQLFASSFLEKYAGGNAETINRLEPYFLMLLSQVNKGRAAKERAFAFLETESMAHAETAALTARLLSRISATIAIRDKAKCIALLVSLQKKYPSIASPLVIRETAEYKLD